MPIEQQITKPVYVEGGHADFLTRKDYLRNSPQAMALYVKNYGVDFTFADLLDSLGMASLQKSIPHQSPFKESYFRDKDQRHFTIKSVVTPQTGAGDEVVLELADDEVRSVTGVLGGVTSTRVRKDETVQDTFGKNWSVTRVDKTSNPYHVTLKPISSLTTATFTAGARFFIIGPSFSEATGQPTGLISDIGKYMNRFAILKETDLTSGTNMTTKNQFMEAVGLKGYAYLNGQEEAENRHELNISTMLVHGQLGDGNITQFSVPFDVDVENRETEGFIQAALTSGKVQVWDKTQGYDLDQLRRAAAHYRQRKLQKSDILVAQGGSVSASFQKDLLDFIGPNNRDVFLANKFFSKMKYNPAEKYSAEDHFISLGFRGVGLDGYNFLFRDITEFNSLYGEGYQSDVDYENMQIFMPISIMQDAKSGAKIPTMQVVHRGQDLGGYQRRNEVWKVGGAGPIRKTDEYDAQFCYFRSEAMLEIVGHYWLLTQIGGSADG